MQQQDCTPLYSDNKDEVWWNFSRDGAFSVKSFSKAYQEQTLPTNSTNSIRGIWKGMTPMVYPTKQLSSRSMLKRFKFLDNEDQANFPFLMLRKKV